MESKRKRVLHQIPNMLSALRIVCTLGLIFVKPMKAAFFTLYSICGLTDVLDGFIARRLHCTSDLGAVLDSVADLSFYGMMFYRIFPIMWEVMARWIWFVGLSGVAIRLVAYGIAAGKYHRFASVHTYMNKVTGFAVFLIPYFIALVGADGICLTAASIGCLASAEEVMLHLTGKHYDENRKTIFMKPAA